MDVRAIRELHPDVAVHAVESTPDGAAFVTEAMAGFANVWGEPHQIRDVNWRLSLRVGFASGKRGT